MSQISVCSYTFEADIKMRRPRVRPPLSKACSLKNELRLQFDYPWGCIRTQTRAIDGRRLTNGLRDLTELVAVHVGVREGKVRMIEEIKEPCANGEMSTLPLRYRKGLLHVEVSVEVTWTAKLIAALDPEIICRVGEISSAIARIG